MATIKGHLDQSRQNQRSTKPKVTYEEGTTPAVQKDINNEEELENNDYWPTSEPDNERTHHCYAGTTEDTTNGKIFTDQTGRFISPSSTGNTQLFILYDYDSNSIHAEPIKNRTAAEILRAFKEVHSTLTKAGLRPKLQRMDNECSALLADYMQKQGIDFQLIPVGQH